MASKNPIQTKLDRAQAKWMREVLKIAAKEIREADQAGIDLGRSLTAKPRPGHIRWAASELIAIYARDVFKAGQIKMLWRYVQELAAKASPAQFHEKLKTYRDTTADTILNGRFNTSSNSHIRFEQQSADMEATRDFLRRLGNMLYAFPLA